MAFVNEKRSRFKRVKIEHFQDEYRFWIDRSECNRMRSVDYTTEFIGQPLGKDVITDRNVQTTAENCLVPES